MRRSIQALLPAVAALVGCAAGGSPRPEMFLLEIQVLDCPVVVDGRLDEPCYSDGPLVAAFRIAGEPGRPAAPTAAWLRWDRDRLVVAFDCADASIVASPPTSDEHDVDRQDRVELFLWSGRDGDPYFSIEISAAGAVHDYRGRFYRQFDDAWQARGLACAVTPRPGGYRVELSLPRPALEEMGLRLGEGEMWRIGLFRADFAPERPESPDWITWIDAGTQRPDFHVSGAFGVVGLMPR